MKNKRGIFWIILGILFILFAIGLSVFNILDDRRAEQTVVAIKEEIQVELAAVKETSTKVKLTEDEILNGEYEIPDFVLNPDMEMPVREIDGAEYIGVLEIPNLQISLPVASEWSYPALRKSPCRYDGTAYKKNMIISAHNYQSHFGNIKTLKEGEEIIFTDIDGNVFWYTVVSKETIQPEDIEGMKSGNWDLTLFTCTLGGQQRVTVRCEQIE